MAPLLKGGVHTRLTLPSPLTTFRSVILSGTKAEGVVDGVAETILESGPSPAALIATTLKLYETPFFRPDAVA